MTKTDNATNAMIVHVGTVFAGEGMGRAVLGATPGTTGTVITICSLVGVR